MSEIQSNKLYYTVLLTQFILLLYFYSRKSVNSVDELPLKSVQMQSFLNNSEIVIDTINIQKLY